MVTRSGGKRGGNCPAECEAEMSVGKEIYRRVVAAAAAAAAASDMLIIAARIGSWMPPLSFSNL